MSKRREERSGPGCKMMVSAKVAEAVVKQIDERARIHHRTRSQEIGYLLELALKAIASEKDFLAESTE